VGEIAKFQKSHQAEDRRITAHRRDAMLQQRKKFREKRQRVSFAAIRLVTHGSTGDWQVRHRSDPLAIPFGKSTGKSGTAATM